jgi:hypothetical protein
MAAAKKPAATRSAHTRSAATKKQPVNGDLVLWLTVIFTALCLTFAYMAYITTY